MIPLTDFVDRLRARIDKQIAEQLAKLAEHRAPDYETYSSQWGLLQGLRTSRNELDELVKQVNSGEM